MQNYLVSWSMDTSGLDQFLIENQFSGVIAIRSGQGQSEPAEVFSGAYGLASLR